MKGQEWCNWIQIFVQGGNSIKVNDHLGPYFQTKESFRSLLQTKKGLRQSNSQTKKGPRHLFFLLLLIYINQ